MPFWPKILGTSTVIAAVAALVLTTSLADASVPFNEIKIRIIDSNRLGKFESEIRKTFKTTKNVFAQREIEILTGILSKGAAFFMSHGDTVSMLVDNLMGILRDESDWRESFAPKLVQQVELSTIENDFQHTDAEMTVILENIRELRHYYGNDFETQKRKLDEIHDRLNIMITRFDQENGLCKKYPMESIPSLFTLAKLYASDYYVTLISINDQRQTEKSRDVACKLHNVLIDYRIETVRKRLNEIDIFDERHEICNDQKLPKLFNVMQRFYNRTGYHRKHVTSIDCVKVPEIPNNSTKYFKDNLGEAGVYFHHDKPEKIAACIYGYMEFIRFQVERFFNEPIDLVQGICSKWMPSKWTQQTTGNGWLTLTIKEVYWMPKPNEEWWNLFTNHKCEIYLKIFIDDDYDSMQTLTKAVEMTSNVKRAAIFYETFKSKKISNRTNIKVEIWNKNDFLQCSDELIGTWLTSVKNLLFEGRYRQDNGNFIDTSVNWKNEIEFQEE